MYAKNVILKSMRNVISVSYTSGEDRFLFNSNQCISVVFSMSECYKVLTVPNTVSYKYPQGTLLLLGDLNFS